MKVTAVVVAGGTGSRMRASIPKQFMLLEGREIFVRSVEVFCGSDFVDNTVLVMHEEWIDEARKVLDRESINRLNIVEGGSTRQESVRNALEYLKDSQTDIVMIHDAARPLFSRRQIPEILKSLQRGTGVVVVESVRDTIYITQEGFVKEIPDRSLLKAAQTPQTFYYDEILLSHRFALSEGIENSTDDTGLFIRSGGRVLTVESHTRNLKITEPNDIALAKCILDLQVRRD